MSQTGIRRLRKTLGNIPKQVIWPAGTIRIAPAQADKHALYALLETAYRNGFGSVPPEAQWWPAIETDDEYDPDLLVIAADTNGAIAGLALCWTSGFIKDLAVSPSWRGHGLGEALLNAAFAACQQRGLSHVDLKVMAGNLPAIKLYQRLGMVDV